MTIDRNTPHRSGSETRQRTMTIAMRLTIAEAAALDAAAKRAGLATGTYLRTVAFGSPGPRAVRRPVPQKVELARVLGLLGRVGGNINQLARAFNTDAEIPEMIELRAIRAELQQMRDALMHALGRRA